MTRELIGGFPAANDRQQMGQFLRYAFPHGVGSFEELLGGLEDDEKATTTERQQKVEGGH